MPTFYFCFDLLANNFLVPPTIGGGTVNYAHPATHCTESDTRIEILYSYALR